jgi:hypothetical protein
VGATASALSASVSSGHELLWYGSSATGGTSSTSAPVPSTASAGTTTYYVSQRLLSTGCESDRSSIVVTVNANPAKPVITRSASNTLVSSAPSGNTWLKDGATVSGVQNFSPTSSGWYALQVSLNGCLSPIADPYYFLVSPLVNFSQQYFFGFYPNPAVSSIKVAFQLDNVQTIYITVYDVQGRKMLEDKRVQNGDEIDLLRFKSGLYFIKAVDNNNKLIYSGKLIKQ